MIPQPPISNCWLTIEVHEYDEEGQDLGFVNVQVIPESDTREHELSQDCWCHPVQDDDDPDVWVHNSHDKREDYDNGILRPS